jgi:hypothetical protein
MFLPAFSGSGFWVLGKTKSQKIGEKVKRRKGERKNSKS